MASVEEYKPELDGILPQDAESRSLRTPLDAADKSRERQDSFLALRYSV